MCYEPTYPQGTLHVWTVPQQANTLGLMPWVPLTRLQSLDTEVTFPPGYERWLRHALAVEVAPEYGREPSLIVVANLAQSIAAIKRTNTTVPLLGLDPAYSGRAAGAWDARTGRYVGRR